MNCSLAWCDIVSRRVQCSAAWAHTSGDLPILTSALRLGEFVATLALAQDNAFGQPLESQLRSCLLATWIVRGGGIRQGRCATPSTGSRCCGTSAAPATRTKWPPSSATRSRSAPRRWCTTRRTPPRSCATSSRSRPPVAPQEEREQIVQMIQQTAHEWAVHNFASGCEVADMLVQRLDFGPGVREALRFTFERWNGNGYPAHAARRGDPAGDARRAPEPRHGGDRPPLLAGTKALEAARDRRDRTYDPALADLFVAHGAAGSSGSPRWSRGTRVLDARAGATPHAGRRRARRRAHGGGGLHRPEIAVHGRTQPSVRAARRRRRAAARARRRGHHCTLRRAALVHDFGTTAVPNSIWDKPGALTRAEFDRVELHPMLTEQMLRRSPALAALNPVACAHHEKSDGSGYHKRVRADAVDAGARRAGRGGDLRGSHHRTRRPSRVLRPRTPPPNCAGSHHKACSSARGRCRARGRRPRRAGGARVQAGAASRRALRSRGRGAAPRGEGTDDADRSPIGCSSRRRPPTTTSSTSTPRSASRRAPPPRSGPCSTPSSPIRRPPGYSQPVL